MRYDVNVVHASKDDLLAQALGLSPDERADLARELTASLDGPADADVETAWAVEVERRLREVDEGGAKVTDWDTVHQRILGRLRSLRR